MKKAAGTTNKTLQALLSGVHPLVKKYGGKQVFVIDDDIVIVKKGKKALSEFKHLKKKHGKAPVVTFVPQPGTSYILHEAQI